MINKNKIQIHGGILSSARFLPSPYCDQRPDEGLIDLLVIHAISLPPKQFGARHVEDFFMGRLKVEHHPYFQTIAHLKVSAHLFISRDGEVIQFVPFFKRAWHAGQSIFQGRVACNDFSIGIELEGADDLPFEDKQYQALALVTQAIQRAYPLIGSNHILGHSDIAPGRKTDPGPCFDWKRYCDLISS